MSKLPRIIALKLLDECTGNDIWPVEYCKQQRVPSDWIDELADAFESSFLRDAHTIYFHGRTINQFHGVKDHDLALKLGEALGVDVERACQYSITPEQAVAAVKEMVEEG